MNPTGESIACFVAGLVLGALAMWLLPRFARAGSRAVPVADPIDETTAPLTAIAATPEHGETEESETIASSRVIDVRAARLAGFNLKHADDLTVIEGIGPKIEDLLRAHGIDSLLKVACLGVDDLREILDRGGASFRFADPASWPQQATLASQNRWIDLKRLHNARIDGGDAPTQT